MAKYIKGVERNQQVLFPTMLDELIEDNNEVRVIDYFVDKIDINEMEIKRSRPNEKGTNHFDPRDMLKIYIYGYRNGIRSSRKLAKLCKINIELKWLVKGIEPDFRTINEFRSENSKCLKQVFKKLVIICSEGGLIGNITSQDGVKIKAVNSKERNFTLNKIDDRLKRIEEQLDKYFKEMDELDKKENQEKKEIKIPSKSEIEEKINTYKKEQEKMKRYLKEIETKGKTQISLTDTESKLMKNNGKYDVAYNNQVLVSENSHIVINYDADNNPADCGTMNKVSREAKETLKKEKLINVTDKGYYDRLDMAKCLEEGIIPEVTLPKGKTSYEIEYKYKEAKITEKEKNSKKPEEIKKCLEAGIVPKIYEEYLEKKEIKEVTITVEEEAIEKNEISEENMRDYAMKNKCFMKTKSEKVYCPMGEILRKKSKNGKNIKYCNKLACKNCKNQCTESKYKEVVMGEKQIISTSNKLMVYI